VKLARRWAQAKDPGYSKTLKRSADSIDSQHGRKPAHEFPQSIQRRNINKSRSICNNGCSYPSFRW